MGLLDEETVGRIKQNLRWHARGMTISDLASKLQMNRNLMAKYLDMLLISGQVEMEVIGAAKVYFVSRRVPVSALLEFSSDLIIMVDRDQRILQVNEQVLSLLGEKREKLIGSRIEDIPGPFQCCIARIEKKGKRPERRGELAEQVEETSCTIQGEERHFRIKGVPTAFEDGSDGFTLIIEEITARKKYQQMLEASEARYRGLVQSSGEAIVGITAPGTISSWNPAARTMFGYDEPEVLKNPFCILISQESQQDLDGLLKRVLGGESIRRHEMKMALKGGTAIDALCTFSPIRGDDQAVTGVSLIIRDITREKIEQHVREQEDRYRRLVEDLNVGIYRSTGDPHGKFVWGNTALLNILGYQSLDELGGIKVAEIFLRPDGRAELLDDLRKGGFVKNRILHLKKPDGSPISVSVTALAEFDEKKDLVYINGIVQDITGYVNPAPRSP